MRIRYFTIFRIYKYSIYSVYNFMKLSRPLYNFLIVSFARCRKYIIFLNSFRKFSDALFAFTCVSTIGNFWSSCLEPNMLSLFPSVTFLSTSTAVTHKFDGIISSVKKHINISHRVFLFFRFVSSSFLF